jgi:hypothetical protein
MGTFDINFKENIYIEKLLKKHPIWEGNIPLERMF